MDRLRSAWDALYSPERHTMFQSFAWNRLAAAHFGDRESPCIVFAEDDNGAAIIPAAINSIGSFVFLGEALLDYRDVLAAGDPAALSDAWSQLAAMQRPLFVTAVRELSRQQWDLPLKPFCRAPRVLRSETSAEEFEAAHRKLGRFARRLQRQGVQSRRYDGSAKDLLRWIYREKSSQHAGEKENIFADESRIDFVIAAVSQNPSLCEIFTFEHGDDVIAALVSFRDGQTRRFYTVYFDRSWAKESPGQVLIFNVTSASLAAGLDCDYMTGEQPHKTRLATSYEQLYRVNLSAEDFASAVSSREMAA